MKQTVLIVLSAIISTISHAQEINSPTGTAGDTRSHLFSVIPATQSQSKGIPSPPPYDQLRCMAEWEEIQALTIAWKSYPGILKKIVAAARSETRVIILTENSASTQNYLLTVNAGGAAFSDLNNITFIEAPVNSVWIRDYGGNPVYGNEVDDLVMVDWIYNRPERPDDDVSPQLIADELGLDLYGITEAPADLVNTGGNWMSDGFGTAFASRLVLNENLPGNIYGVTPKTESEIDQIANDYLGIDRYIKMTTLPYDNIHHIDMHIKLLDEETLLVGEYPEGIADGPQINANIEYVLSGFLSKWDTPYRIIRIPMPNSTSGTWPDSEFPAFYRTYTNAVFVNKTIILPTYREEYDTTAIRIWQESLPGYTIVPIDCDNGQETIIAASGAVHCITHSVGVADPLLISHQPLSDTDNTLTPYQVVAYINHRDGISEGTLFWKTDLNDSYAEVAMVPLGTNNWEAFIPAQAAGTRVYYYIQGQAVTGKTQVRPMPAPEGYWQFDVLGETTGIAENNETIFGKVFPNPASEITCIPLNFLKAHEGTLQLVDMTGRTVQLIHSGHFAQGASRYFFDASVYPAGAYCIILNTGGLSAAYPVMIR